METFDVDYHHTAVEFEQMRSLLVNTCLESKKPFNWRLAMAENWNYASRFLEPVEYFTIRVHLWKNSSGQLASFLIQDNYLVYLQVHYAYRHLEEEMLDWAERHWQGENGHINLMVYDWDIERQQLLAKRGYENLGAIEDIRIYDLTRSYPGAVLPPGFRITSMAEYGTSTERIDLENSVWGAKLDEAWFRGKSSAPTYSPAWDLIAVSPEGMMIAYNLVWLYSLIQAAEIDPLGTHPDYRQRGLGRALLLESFKRMQVSGIRYAYIASEAKDPLVSHLYSSIQPVETYQGYHWFKKIS
jgi:ribosomal protein S18 acetylase RimI-like enzyme